MPEAPVGGGLSDERLKWLREVIRDDPHWLALSPYEIESLTDRLDAAEKALASAHRLHVHRLSPEAVDAWDEFERDCWAWRQSKGESE
jgi:hypothetical protein